MVEILIPITLFASLFGIAFIYLTTRNKERMSLIEKGQSADLFKKEEKPDFWALKLGVMAVGVGLGILIANVLSVNGVVDEETAYPAMIFLFAGMGLVASHYLSKRQTPPE